MKHSCKLQSTTVLIKLLFSHELLVILKSKIQFVGCTAKLTSMTGTKSSLLRLTWIKFMVTKFTWTQEIISVISANTS